MKLLKLADRAVSVLGLILFGTLVCVSMFTTEYFAVTYEEVPISKADIFIVVLAVCAALVFLMHRVCGFVLKTAEQEDGRIRVLAAAVHGFVLIFSIYWVLAAKVVPLGDQASVSEAAEAFLAGDYSLLTMDSYSRYLYIHPHQLGMTALLELVYLIFGSGNYLAFELLNCVGVTAAVYSGYRITRLLSADKRVWVYYLLLSACCFPLLFYAPFVYGEVPSVCLSTAAVWFFLEYRKTSGARKRVMLLLCCAASALACLIRNNCLILLIAFVIILTVCAVAERNARDIAAVVLMVLFFAGARQGLHAFYEYRSGVEINDGAPMILYVAMGMQKEEDGAAGWSNGYILHNYWGEAEFDSELSVSLAEADIKASLKGFLDDPAYALSFYAEKFASQWNDPTYECFEMTHTNGSARGPVANSMYYGKLHALMVWFMNEYQSLVYTGVFACLIFSFRKTKGLEDQVLIVTVIGGFLFSMLWEAKGRYILPYFVMMLPSAAVGLAGISERVRYALGKMKGEKTEGIFKKI